MGDAHRMVAGKSPDGSEISKDVDGHVSGWHKHFTQSEVVGVCAVANACELPSDILVDGGRSGEAEADNSSVCVEGDCRSLSGSGQSARVRECFFRLQQETRLPRQLSVARKAKAPRLCEAFDLLFGS
jgi:hypothetical protein